MKIRDGSLSIFWAKYVSLAAPSIFLLGAIYCEELFLKLYCFRSLTVEGVVFTFLFTLPVALMLGLLCGSVSPKRGRLLLPACTALVSLWIGTQLVYFHMFKAFLSIFSLTKMAMVARSFGETAVGNVLASWFPITVMAAPTVLAWVFRAAIIPDGHDAGRRLRLRWAVMAAAIQLTAMGLVLLCGGGVLSLRYIYYRAATPELEVQNFGVCTQTQLEVCRLVFGIKPDSPDASEEPAPDMAPPDLEPSRPDASIVRPAPEPIPGYHTLPIDFNTLLENEEDEGLKNAHLWFSQRPPAPENLWTGYFEGKNLIWIVAEGFSTLAMDPQRTPALWKLSHQGFVFDHFYTPLWGLSTSDGEYVTTTGLIPKSGVWSYSLSSENYMPFALGSQFRKEGYSTFAFHNYLYNYYDRDKSHPNMGYDYYALGQGLELEETWPLSDLEMMEKIVPMFINEEKFSVYCLTVSGHLTYTLDTNAMSVRHWDAVANLPYSEEVRCYLACQMELELAMESLLGQLEAAGKLDDTVIVLSADHYPYGLTDEQYSELLGHEVDPVFEIFQNTLILWSGDMEGAAVHVDKFCSSLDVMPTLSNLFGLDYDSRLIIGSDILSAEDPLVIFANYSFINGEGYYNSVLDQFTRWDGAAPNLEEVAGMVAEVQNRVAYSATILDTDYYRLVLDGPPKDPKP